MRNEEKRMETQSTRRYELDLLKALAIVAMILCHCVIQLGLHQPGYERDIRYLIGELVFGDYLAVANAFMFAMGVTVNYSRKNSPGALVRRGLSLYVLGFVDSIFCYLLGVVFPWTLIYLFGAALIVLSAWLAERWANRKRTVGTA